MHSHSNLICQAHWSCEVITGVRIDWIDLPKLTSLTTVYNSCTFCSPRHITLESDSHPLWMMFRHAQSHQCESGFQLCIRLQEWRHNPRKYSLHPSLTNRHRSSSTLLQLITERHVTPLFVPHTHNTHFPSTSELVQRHSRERYRCANTEIMTIRIWNDGNPIRIVETGSNDHSLHIAWNPHHSSFQITHIASLFQWEPSLNNWIWQQKHQSSHRTAYLAILSPIITSKCQFHPSIPISEAAQPQWLSHRIHTRYHNPTMNIPLSTPFPKHSPPPIITTLHNSTPLIQSSHLSIALILPIQ